MKNLFRFKKFDVDQDGCAMKINTDGVLLGAMVDHSAPKNILDIGTGTGVIALMLAQRYADSAVEAVEIDEQAASTSQRNFSSSIFSSRLTAFHSSIEDFNTSRKFDLIVTNPPFFVNDYKNAEPKKKIARHASDAFFKCLVQKVGSLLSDNGSFWFVLPIKQAEDVVFMLEKDGFYTNKIIHLHSDNEKAEFRRIVCVSRSKIVVKQQKFVIYERERVYTKAYEILLKDFFLAY